MKSINYRIKIVLIISLVSLSAFSMVNSIPTYFVKMSDFFNHHLLLVEKSTHMIHLYQYNGNGIQIIKSFHIATGKKSGDKKWQGDFRTPEGIFHFTEFIPNKKLKKMYGKEGEIYGIGAFVMNYPTPHDVVKRKTGSGIWLHSTNDETRIEKGLDSRGCVVVANKDLQEISKYVELKRTPIIVTHNINYLSNQSTVEKNNKLNDFFTKWLESWKNKDLKSFISNYSPTKYKDNFRKSFSEFKNYKRAVFSNPGNPTIDAQQVSIIEFKGNAVISYIQKYESKTIQDIGIKRLYLKKDEYYQWKIISETWSRLNELPPPQVSFNPSMRFFTSAN